MVDIGKHCDGCRYWGYNTALSQDSKARSVDKGLLRLQIKESGLKPSEYGLTKTRALAAAQLVEERTGIPMAIFNHDYL